MTPEDKATLDELVGPSLVKREAVSYPLSDAVVAALIEKKGVVVQVQSGTSWSSWLGADDAAWILGDLGESDILVYYNHDLVYDKSKGDDYKLIQLLLGVKAHD